MDGMKEWASFAGIGAVAASLGHLIDGLARMESLFTRAAALSVSEDVVRALIAAEQRRTKTSIHPFNWERVKNQIDHKAGVFG